jgi:ABC-2 type transport system ATP-binding protein
MVCNRVIIINRGRLVALDTPIHLAEGAGDAHTIELEIGGVPADVLKGLRAVSGVKSARISSPDGVTPTTPDKLAAGVHDYQVESQVGADIRPELATAIVGGGFQLLELKAVKPSLEDVFVNIISQDVADDDTLELDGDDADRGEAESFDEPEEEAVVASAPRRADSRERVTAKRRVRR